MAEPLTCPLGHQWQAPGGAGPGLDTAAIQCPYCGRAANTVAGVTVGLEPLGGGSQETGIYCPGQSEPSSSPASRVPTPSARAERGRYTVLSPHAHGGLGQVSLARDEDLGRQVALKEIRPEYADDPQSQDRFLNEAEITGQLEHPGVVPVYSLGRDASGRPYYAMRFIRGQTLHAAISAYHRNPTPLAFRALLRRFVDVCQTVAYAHSQNVIHRDLKPANIMLGDYGETLVLDWGLAKRLGGVTAPEHLPMRGVELATAKYFSPAERAELPSPELTAAGSILGTPAYMSPEQAQGDTERIGGATDIYALGVILFEILTGRLPFQADTTEAVLAKVIGADYAPPSQHKRHVPRALEAICRKAMARRIRDRYRNASELAQDVERWLADEPVLAYREPFRQRCLRWARRHRTWVAGLFTLALTAVVLVIAFLIVHQMLIRQEQAQTEQQKLRAERNFQRTREAVDKMLTKVGDRRLAHIPGMDLVRQELLVEALHYYEEFLAEQGPNREMRFDTAAAFHRVGVINSLLRKDAAAREAFEQAIALLDELHRESVGDPHISRKLAQSSHDLGWLLHNSQDPVPAESYYRRSLELLHTVPPLTSDLAWNEQRAQSHHDLGLLLKVLDRPADARAQMEEALSLRKRLLLSTGREAATLRSLAQVHNDMGELLRANGTTSLAEEHAREAVRLQEEVLDATSGNPEYLHELVQFRYELAAFINNLGLLLSATDPAAAESAHTRARTLSEELVNNFPTRPVYRLVLAQSCLNEGLLHLNQGISKKDTEKYQLARQVWETALTHFQRLVSDYSEVPDYQSDLAQTLNNLGTVAYYQRDLQAAQKFLETGLGHQRKAWKANPRNPLYRERLRDNLIGLGDLDLELGTYQPVASLAREVTGLFPSSGGVWLRAARQLAGSIPLVEKDRQLEPAARQELVDSHGREACQMLARALERGVPANELANSAFDSIRGRRDFPATAPRP